VTVRNASRLVVTLEHAWATIRARHPQVPEAVLVASGSSSRRLKWGHFAAGRWQHAGSQHPEVLVGGEGLARGAREVLATLLHEAGHGLAAARGIQDTSRGGRHHNRRFAALAGELGLEVARAGGIGWSATTPPEATAAAYAEVLAELEARLVLWRPPGGCRPSGQLEPAGLCLWLPAPDPGRPLNLAQAPILCAACALPFTP
jgi:hypothetical protein